jgi:PKD repeat protein
VTATDDGSPALSASTSFTWTVTDVNRPPQVFDPGDRSDAEGDRVTFAVRASDPDGDRIRWAALNLPDGITIDAETGVVSGVLSFDSVGTYTVTVTVTDDGSPSRSASVQFTWSVAERNRPPVLLPFGDRTGLVGDAVDVMLQASDPDGDPVTWSMSGLPTGLGFDGGRISGTLEEPGVYTVSVRVTDPYGGSASGSFTWTVTAPAAPPDEPGWPVIGRLPNRSDLVGDTVTLQPEAGHPDDLELRFSAVGLPTGTSIDPGSGLISGTLTVAGDYTVIIRVTDPDGRSAAATFLWMVEVPPNEAPSAGNDEVTIDVDEITDGVRVDVLGNDSDPEGRPLEIVSAGQVPVGSVTVEGSQIVFRPPAGWTGRVSFLYTVGDDGGNQATGLVTVIVRPPAEERAGTDIAVWDDAGTELRLTPDASSELVLGSLFQSLHVLRMPLTLLGSAVLASLLLGGLLNLGFVLHRGIPMFARTNRRRVAVVLVAHGERLDVLDKPGAEGTVVHRFVATEAGVIATGRDRELDGETWIEVEAPAGPGWVPQRNLTEHVDAESFAEDPEVYDVLNDFVDALRTRGDIGPIVSRYGLWVAHHDTPLHYEHRDLARIMDDASLHTWKGRNLAYPDQRATFDVAVAGGVVDAWNHPRRELVANQPAVPSTVIPVEFTNLNAISIGADLQGPARLDQTAWLVHYSFERGHPRIIGLTKEG